MQGTEIVEEIFADVQKRKQFGRVSPLILTTVCVIEIKKNRGTANPFSSLL